MRSVIIGRRNKTDNNDISTDGTDRKARHIQKRDKHSVKKTDRQMDRWWTWTHVYTWVENIAFKQATLSDKISADKSAENLASCRKFCPPKYFVRRKFCPPKFCPIRYSDLWPRYIVEGPPEIGMPSYLVQKHFHK